MTNFKSPLLRWLAVVFIIVGFSIATKTIYYSVTHTSNVSGVYNIHFVNYRGRTEVDAGFEEYLRQHGVRYYITYHNLDFNIDNAGTIRSAIEADEDADLIVTWGTLTTIALIGRYDNPVGGRIGEIPVVFTMVTSPDLAGIIKGRFQAREGVTGASHIAPIYNQFRTMMTYHPAKKIGMLFTPSEINSVLIYQALSSNAKAHDVEIVALGFSVDDNGKPSADNAVANLRKLKAEGVEWLYLPPDVFLGSKARDIVIPEAHRLGIRTFASTEQLMLSGAAYGLISPYKVVGNHAGQQARSILVDGKPPSTINIDIVPRFIHQINIDVLNEMGLDFPIDKFGSVEILNRSSIR